MFPACRPLSPAAERPSGPPLLFAFALAAGCLTGVTLTPLSAADGLTESQRRSGWETLFDGESFEGWRNYRREGVSDGWVIDDQGVLTCRGRGAGDLITERQYGAFELMLEYRLTDGANSGVMFHVRETDGPAWHTGPEIQLFDSAGRPNAEKSGWLYQLYRPAPPRTDDSDEPLDAERPAGEWNQLYLRVSPEQSEVCLNGMLYYRFVKGSDDWERRVADSKFAKLDAFAAADSGHIALQEHGDEVAFRNIKIRVPGDDGEVPQPIDGRLPLVAELAFPQLKWEGWEAIDDAGRIRALRILELTTPRDDSDRLFASSQAGRIYVFENRRDVADAKLFLDLNDLVADWSQPGRNEQGLLGLAFHPAYAANGRFFVCYTAAEDDRTVIAEYRVSDSDPDRADPDSARVLMEIAQPFRNHNGGSIEFGPDGYLYIGLGDGGYRNDPQLAGQDLTQWLGSILRIDVDRTGDGKAYGIPADNPFASPKHAAEGYRPEIYAYGLRNVWRLAFDRATGKLWAADVGQELIEEINLIRPGGNYGWSLYEGTLAFGNRDQEPPHEPIDPIWEYDHQIGKSITGGRVYRGERLPELAGKYLYADYISGRVWALETDTEAGRVVGNHEIIDGGTPVLAFGEDAQGEIYFMTADMKGEGIYRLVREPIPGSE